MCIYRKQEQNKTNPYHLKILKIQIQKGIVCKPKALYVWILAPIIN